MTATADATDSIEVEQLAQAVADLQKDLEAAHERIDALEDELAEHRTHDGQEHANINRRITETEDAVEAIEEHTPETETASEASNSESQTPLERIVSLPEYVADRELTANQERARFIAQDVRDYAEKAPAGLVVDSRTIKRVLTASEGKRPHTQTVARVMEFLADLGKNDVKLIKRRGKKLVVFDPDAADRYHDRCDRAAEPGGPNAVISGP